MTFRASQKPVNRQVVRQQQLQKNNPTLHQ